MTERTVDARKGEQAIAALLCLLGIYVFWKALHMPAGTFATPGPGFFPRAVGLMLAVAVAAAFIVLRRGETQGRATFVLHQVFACLGVLLLIAAVFKPAGALISLGAMVVVLVKVLGRTAWWKAVAFGFGMSFFVWLVFIRLLGVQLPGLPL